MSTVALPIWLAPLVDLEADAEAVEELEPEPEPVVVVPAVFEVGLPAVEDADEAAVRVAMLMVVLRAIPVPVAALAVPMTPVPRGTVVEAVPLAETVMLAEGTAELEMEADALAPWTTKGPK